jgi:hypothetical protein
MLKKILLFLALTVGACHCYPNIEPAHAQFVPEVTVCVTRPFCGRFDLQPAFQSCYAPAPRSYCEARVPGSVFYRWYWL